MLLSKLNKSNLLMGYFLALIGSIFWGFSGTFSQFLFQERNVSPEWLITSRSVIAGILLVLFAYIKRGNRIFDIFKNKKDTQQLLVFSTLGILGVQSTYFYAIKNSNAATATVLQFLGPVFISFYYTFSSKKLPKLIEVFSLILALTGTFLIVTHGSFEELTITRAAFFWGIATAFTLAFYSIHPIRLLNKYDSASVVGMAMLIGGLLYSIFFPIWPVPGHLDLFGILSITFVIIFGTLISYYAYLSAIKIIGAKITSLLTCAEPLSAVILAVIWLKIPFGIYDWIGTVMILATIVLLTLFKDKTKNS